MFVPPVRLFALSAALCGLLIGGGTAVAQRPTYPNVSTDVPQVCDLQSASHGCPCPCPPGEAPIAAPTDMPVDESDLPEVADLASDAVFASAPQTAVPNAIGDTLGFGGCFVLNNGLGDVISACPGGGRKYKATNNNSALPQQRIYYNYHYFDNAFALTTGGNTTDIDVNRHELGFEYPFWCNLASVQVQVPFNNTIDNDLDISGGIPPLKDTEFGNVAIALKGVLYQDCCKTISAGVGVDLPTADDFTITHTDGVLTFENETVTISPYLAVLMADPCSNMFMHGFAQVALPLNENTISIDDYTTVVSADIEEATLLYLDGSIGYWLNRDCCGNGLAAIFELHYTANLSGGEVVTDPVFPGASLTRVDADFFHATFGLTALRGCWMITPAVVAPLLDSPDRFFDWEALVQVNRRF